MPDENFAGIFAEENFTGGYGVSPVFSPKEKYGPEKTPLLDTFQAVLKYVMNDSVRP